ncbi:uncharacterized protein [Rhodnius prolixus]|uniref:uncharacterized protein n=1 Tax=Rhodnius prolixus TaxID=13249 RepID=UPI003D18FC33
MSMYGEKRRPVQFGFLEHYSIAEEGLVLAALIDQRCLDPAVGFWAKSANQLRKDDIKKTSEKDERKSGIWR